MRGIFALDPGGKSGLAWGIFNDKADTVADAMRNGLYKGSATVIGGEAKQIKEIFDFWQQFKEGCVRRHLLEPEQVDLVIEDFILLPGQHAGGKEGISPARIGWGFEGYRLGRGYGYRRHKHITQAVWQPATAMRYEKKLKDWDCWVVGKEHERSAFCHIGARLMKVLR